MVILINKDIASHASIAMSKVMMFLQCCLSALIFNNSAFAADESTEKVDKVVNPYAKSRKITLPKNTHFLYVGAGMANKLFNVIVEKPTSYGNVYAKVGQYNEGNGVAGLIGYRYPYKLTQPKQQRAKKKNNNGVYVGVFGGHVMNIRDDNSKKDDKRFNRLGGGIDISYLWFDSSRIGALSAGLFLPEKSKLTEDKVVEPMPHFMMSFSLSAGFF